MQVLVLHLSDLHVRGALDQVVVEGPGRILRAIKDLSRVDACLIAISGDIANTGSAPEYVGALTLVEALSSGTLTQLALNSPPQVVVVPGNHDCDFSDPMPERDRIVEQLEGSSSFTPDLECARLCCKAQEHFESFKTRVEKTSPLHSTSPLFSCYEFTYDRYSLRIAAYNTAWMSSKHEKQGSLVFPVGALPAVSGDADVAIAIMHHPTNWFRADVARTFRQHVESLSDFVLTGHEHVADTRITANRTGAVTEQFEGGVLQDHGNALDSSFTAIILDLPNRSRKVFHCHWQNGLYVTDRAVPWDNIRIGTTRLGRTLTLTDTYQQFLDDPGVVLEGTDAAPATLRDVFVWPDVREMRYRAALQEPGPLIKGDLLEEALSSKRAVLLSGEEQSGKTTLAKYLFAAFYRKGLAPVLISGKEARLSTEEALRTSIGKAACEAYGKEGEERLWQLPKENRVLIVDDFHRVTFKKGQVDTFAKAARAFARNVIILADDLGHAINQVIRADAVRQEDGGVTHYRLQPFGHERRNALAERWFLLPPGTTLESKETANAIRQAKRTMDTVIGKNYVPAYPVYLLAVLNAQSATTEVDVHASTHGYFYELFIRTSLAKGLSHVELDIKLAYLAYVAYAFHKEGIAEVSEERLREIHDGYSADYAMRSLPTWVRHL